MSTKKVEATPWPDDEVEEVVLPEVIPFNDAKDAENTAFTDRQQRIQQRRLEIETALHEPLESSLVKRRLVNPKQPPSKQNPYLDYLEWPTVVRNLNRIFGYGQWDMEVVHIDLLGNQPQSGAPYAAIATVKLTVHFADHYDETADYTNVGTGELRYDSWKGLDMAVKGAVWDGVKRCATALGDQFGLSLYEKDTPEATNDDDEEQPTRVSQFKPRTTPPSTDKSGEMESFECEDCGKEVKGYTSKAGKTYTATDLYNMSVKFAGAGYCYDCKQKHQTN